MKENTSIPQKIKGLEPSNENHKNKIKLESIGSNQSNKCEVFHNYLQSKIKNVKKQNNSKTNQGEKDSLRTFLRNKENVNSGNKHFGILSKNTIVKSLQNTGSLLTSKQNRKDQRKRKGSCMLSRQMVRENRKKSYRFRPYSSNKNKKENYYFELNPWKHAGYEDSDEDLQNYEPTLPYI